MFTTRTEQIMNNVIVVGCGGTAGRLIPLISQLMSRGAYQDLFPTITLIDGDEVEVKNLNRQNFIAEDVGRNKAEVLAERYGNAFEIPIIAIPHFYENSGDMRSWLVGRLPENMRRLVMDRPYTIFLCVDNMVARFNIISGVIQDTRATGTLNTIIDAGNENTYGQVRVFHSRLTEDWTESTAILDRLVGGTEKLDIRLPYIPCPIGEYLDGTLYKGNPDASCADLEQTGAVNAQMATGMFTIFQNIYMMMPIGVETWFYDIHNGNDQTRLARSWIEDLLYGTRYKIGERARDLEKYPVDQRAVSSLTSTAQLWDVVKTKVEEGLKKGTLERMSPELAEALGL